MRKNDCVTTRTKMLDIRILGDDMHNQLGLHLIHLLIVLRQNNIRYVKHKQKLKKKSTLQILHGVFH